MTKSVLIHCQPSLLNFVKENNMDWEYSTDHDVNEIDVYVDDVEYKDGNHPDQNGIWEDPDIQLCEHYGIDYDQVNCIEAVY